MGEVRPTEDVKEKIQERLANQGKPLRPGRGEMDRLGAGRARIGEGFVEEASCEPLLMPAGPAQIKGLGFEQPRFYYGIEVSFKQLELARGRLRKVGGEGGRNSTSQLSVSRMAGHREEASAGGVTR